MTSASELFYTRRSRLGRPDSDFGSDPSLSRSFHHRRHRNNHQNRHETDDCDPLRRASRPRPFAVSERRSIRNSPATTQLLSRNSGNGETQNGNERLPGAVLLARARLVERLRGVYLSGNRRSNRGSSADDQRDSMSRTDSSFIESTDNVSLFPDLTLQQDASNLSEEYNKKPYGLTTDAINRLKRKVFISSSEVNNDTTDCSICLEGFTNGDILISLHCSHSFHSSCLAPWLITCGKCPYCRRAIVK